jgi:hypothetical protein
MRHWVCCATSLTFCRRCPTNAIWREASERVVVHPLFAGSLGDDAASSRAFREFTVSLFASGSEHLRPFADEALHGLRTRIVKSPRAADLQTAAALLGQSCSRNACTDAVNALVASRQASTMMALIVALLKLARADRVDIAALCALAVAHDVVRRAAAGAVARRLAHDGARLRVVGGIVRQEADRGAPRTARASCCCTWATDDARAAALASLQLQTNPPSWAGVVKSLCAATGKPDRLRWCTCNWWLCVHSGRNQATSTATHLRAQCWRAPMDSFIGSRTLARRRLCRRTPVSLLCDALTLSFSDDGVQYAALGTAARAMLESSDELNALTAFSGLQWICCDLFRPARVDTAIDRIVCRLPRLRQSMDVDEDESEDEPVSRSRRCRRGRRRRVHHRHHHRRHRHHHHRRRRRRHRHHRHRLLFMIIIDDDVASDMPMCLSSLFVAINASRSRAPTICVADCWFAWLSS